MNNKLGIFATLIIAMTLMLSGIQEAQAKRFGGGSSFGSRPSYSQPFQPSTAPNSFTRPAPAAGQQASAAAAQNQAARQTMGNRGGLMGMLGGLALGGLLGSMFFGGAFEHINFMDMLLFAGLVYLLFKLFAGRTAGQNQPVTTPYNYEHPNTGMGNSRPSASFDTDILSRKNSGNAYAFQGADQANFLTGAERAFRHLQSSWDKRDLAAIRGLTTDKVFAEIQDQLRGSGNDNKTEVLQLKAELLEVTEQGTQLEASVLFTSLMRENDSAPEMVREVWHFIKPVSSTQPKWFLDGIQQLTE